MPLDPNIILKATNQVSPPFTQMADLAKAQQDQAIASQEQIKTQGMQQAQADDAALRHSMMSSGGDWNAAVQHLMQVNPVAGMKLQDAMYKRQEALLDHNQKITETVAQEAGAVLNAPDAEKPAALDRAKRNISALGIDTSQFPATFDAATIGQIRDKALTAQQQVANERLRQEAQIKADEERRKQLLDFQKEQNANTPKPGTSGYFLATYAKDKGKSVADLTGPEQLEALKQFSQSTQRASALGGMNALYADVDPKAVADGIRRGEVPPDLANMSRPAAAAVTSELMKPGPNGEPPFRLASAQREWKAQINLNRTMNGSQQVRLDESIKSGLAMYDKIDELADQWDSKGWGPLSRANMTAARNGALGERAASVANQLTGQIAQLTSDVATIEQGGLTPTNESRAVAEKSLQDWWSRGTIHDMTAQGRYNMQIRHLAQTQQEPKTPGNVGGMGDVPAKPSTPKASVPEGRIHVVGPNGQTGTVPKGAPLPPGWKEG